MIAKKSPEIIRIRKRRRRRTKKEMQEAQEEGRTMINTGVTTEFLPKRLRVRISGINPSEVERVW